MSVRGRRSISLGRNDRCLSRSQQGNQNSHTDASPSSLFFSVRLIDCLMFLCCPMPCHAFSPLLSVDRFVCVCRAFGNQARKQPFETEQKDDLDFLRSSCSASLTLSPSLTHSLSPCLGLKIAESVYYLLPLASHVSAL